ncbi:MAG: hypothetical protein QM817_02750 [Archangium sp.]
MRRLLAIALCLSACQPQTQEGPPRYVGTVDGTDALIGVAVEDGTVIAYVCGKDSWQTRTGWFATSLTEGTTEGAVESAQSASGHTLESAVVERTRVTGTIRFADGTSATFTAERADPSTNAGLYDTTTSEGQAGLIVTNDLQFAGAASALDPDTLEVTRSQVGVGGTLSGASTGSVRVTIPNLTTTVLTPVVPTQQSVNGSSPLLFILAHGMSHPIDSELSLVDTPFYSRGEWSVDFLRGLLGAAPNAQNQLFTFLAPFTDPNYRNVGASFPATLAEADIAANAAIPANFVTLVPVDITPPSITNLTQLARPAPPVSLFITYRDAPGGLVQSGQRVANQAYLAVRWYELRFKRTPRVVFVTQSFGGLATRFVLSTPTVAELNTAQVPFDGVTLTAEDTRRSAYVRDRTMSVVTLGTPHEGSFLADLAVPIQTSIQDSLRGLRSQTGNGSPAERFGQQLRVAANFFPQLNGAALTTEQVLRTSEDALNELSRRVNGRALRDLRHPFLATVNQGPLHPKRARRVSSPIVNASNQLIPIYTAGSRSPGGRAFDAPELSAFSRYQAEGETERRWITLTMAADLGVRLARAQGYGSSTTTLLAPFDARLDRRRRIVDFGAFVRERAETVAGQLSPWLVQNQSATTTALDATTRLALGPAQGLSLPIYLANEGSFDLGGSVTVPALGFQCTTVDGQVFRFVLDFGVLITRLVQTYSNLEKAANMGAAPDLNALISALGVLAADVDGVKTWFLDKYNGLQVPDGRCRLPSDVSIASLFSVANIGNWSVVKANDTFPAPRWVRGNAVAQDDEIDTDGAVAFDSAVGLTLGTNTPMFFDHTRTDDVRSGVPVLGSWYRFFDSPIEPDCHGMQHQFVAGEWVIDTFGAAGPIPRASGLGSFTQ